MCGCEHHWDTNAPCTCQCPEHEAIREEDARRAEVTRPAEADAGLREAPPDCGCGHSLKWHHERRGCGYHGFSDSRCLCLMPFDDALTAILADALAAVVAERGQPAPQLPFTLRMPTNRADNPEGVDLNTGTQHVDVQVFLDPTMDKRGECRRDYYGGPVIALREWDEQVFLHELLHAATGYTQPPLTVSHPPEGHDVISRIEVALWETGWRLRERVQPAGEAVEEWGWRCTSENDRGRGVGIGQVGFNYGPYPHRYEAIEKVQWSPETRVLVRRTRIRYPDTVTEWETVDD